MQMNRIREKKIDQQIISWPRTIEMNMRTKVVTEHSHQLNKQSRNSFN